MTKLASLTTVLLAASISAQGAVAPPLLRGPQPTPGLNPPAVPFSKVEGVRAQRLPGDRPGTWSMTLNGTGLSAAHGGAGGFDLLSGTYHAIGDRFTPDKRASALNTAAAHEASMRILHTGLVAVFDRYTLRGGAVWVARRATPTSAWRPVGPIRNLSNDAEHDPALALHGGKLQLIYLEHPPDKPFEFSIAMAPLDLQTLTVGKPRVLVRSRHAAGAAHSPAPIVDSAGELIGLSHQDGVIGSTLVGSHHFSFDLDPSTPPQPTFGVRGMWMMYAGFAGGTVFNVEKDFSTRSSPTRVVDARMVWWTGGRAAIGSDMEVRAHVPPRASGIAFSQMVLSRGYLTTPFRVAGLGGLVGIEPAGMVALPIGVHVAATGEAVTTIRIPSDTSLRGVRIPGQSVTTDVTGNAVIAGNTAALTIE